MLLRLNETDRLLYVHTAPIYGLPVLGMVYIRLKDSCDIFMLMVSNSQIECKYNVVEVDAFSTIAK